MKREDIAHLATLSRLELTESELDSLGLELSSIMSYVSVISEMASDDVGMPPRLGARHNVFRADVVTNEADEYTSDLLVEMPHTEGRYMKVKKIIGATQQ
jgi:aspartyl-tRNA(Asn)/glutamyl-tRNA(Gln) amidotransferase subunit C